MKVNIEAACGCNMGKIRKNNEDNFFFHGTCLPAENEGMEEILVSDSLAGKGTIYGVFDGVGGECLGEVASYAAAECLKEMMQERKSIFQSVERYLNNLCMKLNEAVVIQKQEHRVSHMGSTSALLYVTAKRVYALNIGDSRIYRLKDNKLTQLSKDHCAKSLNPARKPAITQYLGLDSDEMEIEPYMAQLPVESGDAYLVCSDGLTDMVSDLEIERIMTVSDSTQVCVNNLIAAALEHGGRDNVTAIICKIK